MSEPSHPNLPPTGDVTSSAEDFPARTSATTETVRNDTASTGNAQGSGPNLPGSFASYDHDMSLWRTYQRSLYGGLEEFLATWPNAGMTRNGVAFLLPLLVPHTFVNESFLLPTPTTGDAGGARNATSGRKPGSRHHSGTTLTDWIWLTVGRGYVHPEFAEWMQGFPIGWTDCEPSAMSSCHK